MRISDIKIGEYYRLKYSPDYGYIKVIKIYKPREYKEEYKEKGFTAKRIDKDISNEVKVSGKVNTSKLGTYKIKYEVEIEHHLNIGDTITPYRTNLDGCGYVIAHGYDVDDAICTANRVKEIIDQSIIRY